VPDRLSRLSVVISPDQVPFCVAETSRLEREGEVTWSVDEQSESALLRTVLQQKDDSMVPVFVWRARVRHEHSARSQIPCSP
jgi:hypothetical protein